MICKATAKDSRLLAEIAVQMWEDNTVDALEAEFADLVRRDDAAAFIRYADDQPIGFAQCGLRRDYVEGTDSTPVGYLEGIFVKAEYRNRGFARELLSACENWAKNLGCTEFASDCELDNTLSLKFHMAVGFTEANRIICFRKDI